MLSRTIRPDWNFIGLSLIGLLLASLVLVACSDESATKQPASSPAATGQNSGQNGNGGNNQDLPDGIDPAQLVADLNGSGSTLVAPALKIWQQEFGKIAPKVRINYQGGGSGQGRTDILTGKSEFGDSDVQISKDEATKTGNKFEELIQIPATLAAVVLVYNLPGVEDIKLDQQMLTDIYSGKLKKWNDDKIKQANPDAKLPDLAIKLAVRSDSSGTSEVFASYLTAISPELKEKLGKPSGSPKWENLNINVTAASGNDGIAGLVKQSEGSLGYTEIAFATQNKLSFAQLKNKGGQFIKPTLESISAAAEKAKPDENLKVNLVDQEGEKAYPLTTTTYLLIKKDYQDKNQGQAVVAFVWFALHKGGELAKKNTYAPLPPEILKKAEEKLKSVTAGGQKILN